MPMDDAQAVRASLDGSPDAFDALVERYAGALSALAHDRLGTVAEAQDAVQAAFTEAYRKLHTLRDPSAFSSWVYGILRNECAMRLRAKGVDRRALSVIADKRAGNRPLTPLERLEADERSERLRTAVEKLSPALREIVVLRYIGGAGRQEAAAMLELSLSAADKRLERALRELRDMLRE